MKAEIGKFYRVPCVMTKSWGSEIIPINGPLHEDREIIGFDPEHWHIDWRFVSHAFFKLTSARASEPRKIHSIVACKMMTSRGTSEVFFKRLKCKRPMPDYPTLQDGAEWLPALEKLFRDAKLNCMICPHRGISLESAIPVNGVAVCPGHGLAWNLETGRLVSRL